MTLGIYLITCYLLNYSINRLSSIISVNYSIRS